MSYVRREVLVNGDAIHPMHLPEATEVPEAAAVGDIADPVTASAEDVANKLNDLLASLRTAGLLAE